MGGDQPDWTERGKIPSGGNKKRGPDSRAPDWQADPAKKAAKEEKDKRERGELVVAIGPFCVPCGKRFAKQSVYDAHLSGKKHLAALQRMGRHEEAMVCQLDLEAKKRKIAEAEEAKHAVQMASMGKAAAKAAEAADEEAAAARRAEREEKIRQRDMLPMPKCVTATSVYLEGAPDDESAAQTSTSGGEGSSSSSAAASTSAAPPPAEDVASASIMAAVGSGTAGFSYTSGTQDGAARTNRFTSDAMAASHRALAQPSDDWFNLRPPTSS